MDEKKQEVKLWETPEVEVFSINDATLGGGNSLADGDLNNS